MLRSFERKYLVVGLLSTLWGSFVPIANAGTIVRFDTNMGTFDVGLFDDAAPQTVANFLNYVNTGRYDSTILHRMVRNFIVQGGAFTTTYDIEMTDPSPVNEFNHSNVRGTIAMAKRGDDPNSATNQWFVNLGNNGPGTNGLDTQNDGFTVFGKVMGNGMDVLDAINQLPYGDFTDEDYYLENGINRFGISPLVDVSGLPVRNYTQANYEVFSQPNEDNLLIVNNISVIGSYDAAFQNDGNSYDPDNDGTVALVDLLQLVDDFSRGGEQALGSSFVGPLYVDIDGNERFNQSDIKAFVKHFNTMSSLSGGLLSSFSMSSSFTATPEPASVWMAASMLPLFLAWRRRVAANCVGR